MFDVLILIKKLRVRVRPLQVSQARNPRQALGEVKFSELFIKLKPLNKCSVKRTTGFLRKALCSAEKCNRTGTLDYVPERSRKILPGENEKHSFEWGLRGGSRYVLRLRRSRLEQVAFRNSLGSSGWRGSWLVGIGRKVSEPGCGSRCVLC